MLNISKIVKYYINNVLLGVQGGQQGLEPIVTIGFPTCGRFPSGGSRKVFRVNNPFPPAQDIGTFQHHAVDRNNFNMIVSGQKVTNDCIYRRCLSCSYKHASHAGIMVYGCPVNKRSQKLEQSSAFHVASSN